jgi:cysteine-rich repeat protein
MRSSSFGVPAVLGALLSLVVFDARAQTPLACGADSVATIAVNGEVDTYSFSGVAGEVVAIAVGESIADNLFEPCWQLFAPGGAPVNSPSCAPGGVSGGTPAQVITLPLTGTYTISVSEQQGTRTGSYEINWHGLSTSNSCGEATPFCGDIAGAASPGGDIDTYAFDGTAGQIVAIAVGEVLMDNAFEPCWQLYGPTGAVNALTCAPGGVTAGTIAQTISLPATGRYTITVSEATADFRTGTYQLNVHGLSSTNACGAAAPFCADPTAEISPGGDIDTYAFGGIAGQVVTIAVGEILADNAFAPCWQLFAPDGSPVNPIACAPAGVTSGTPAQVIALPVTGNYTIEVTEATGQYRTGTYQLDVHGLSASNACGDPAPFCADLASALTPAADVDTYSFAGTAGQAVAISVGEILADNAFTPCWRMFGPDGSALNALACSPNASTSGTPVQVLTLPVSGTYTIQVSEALGQYRTGTYQIHVHGLSQSNACGSPMTLCTDNLAAITPAGDLDTYQLSATAGDVVTVAVGETVLDNAFNACWQIFGPSGAALNTLSCGGAGTPPEAIPLPVTGTYTVLVTEQDGAYRSGEYGVKADGVSASVTCGPALGCGSDAVTTLSRYGEMDTYRYAGAAGELLSISIGEPVADNLLDLCGQLFDPNGVSVGARTCGTLNTTLRLLRTLPSAGTYTLEVSEQEADRLGSYAYSLQRILPTAQQCGQSTACGAPALGGIAQRAGDTKTYAFLAGAGDIVTISVSETFTSAGFTPCWQLLAPSGAAVGAVQCGAATAAGVRTLTETGVHTIEVSEDALDTAWVYSVTVTGPLAAGVCTTPCGNGALDAGEACDDGSIAGVDCCSPLCQVVPDSDADTLCDRVDNCPTVVNDQSDTDMDGVGQACDTCPLVPNAPVSLAQRQVWMTLVSGQRDDDADGRGNRCDFDHDNVGAVISSNDFNQGKASLGDVVTGSLCGTGNTTPCGRFDQDETGQVISNSDFNLLKAAALAGGVLPARCGAACTPPFTGAIGKAPCEGPGC